MCISMDSLEKCSKKLAILHITAAEQLLIMFSKTPDSEKKCKTCLLGLGIEATVLFIVHR